MSRSLPAAVRTLRQAIIERELFDEGQRVATFDVSGSELKNAGIRFITASLRGHYGLQVGVKESSETTVLPLIVALPPIEGWVSMWNVFPVDAWVRSGPMPQRRFSSKGTAGDLEDIDRLELGVNTWGPSHNEPLIEAFNALRTEHLGNTKIITREQAPRDPEGAADSFMHRLDKKQLYAPNVVSIYVADEPPDESVEMFRMLEDRYAKEAPNFIDGDRPPPLLADCLVGYGEDRVPKYWKDAKSGLRMSREYCKLGLGKHGESLAPVAHFMTAVEKYQGYGEGGSSGQLRFGW